MSLPVDLAVNLEEVFMSTDAVVLVERDERGIVDLIINRPNQLNALNKEVLQSLEENLKVLNSDNSVRAVVLRGSGEKAFIAGADIKEMQEMKPAEATEFARLGQRVTLLFENLKVPTIAVVQGFALGGGCEMAMACDFIYATQAAVFGQPEVKLGLIPGFGGTQRLARLIGRNRAKEVIYGGQNIKSHQALSWGLVNAVFNDITELNEALDKYLDYCTANSPLAIGTSKKCINRGVDQTVEQGLEVEAEEFGAIFGSYDMKEGTAAFVEKRKAAFKGE